MYVGTLNTILILMTSVYLPPYHSYSSKTRGGRRKNIMYRNGDICCTGGQFHPGKMMVWKFRPSVVYLKYMSTVDEKLKYLFRSKGDLFSRKITI